jgi:hypothetical protein
MESRDRRESGRSEGATKDMREEWRWTADGDEARRKGGGGDGGDVVVWWCWWDTEGCGLPSLLRRATIMTLVQGYRGPSPTRLPVGARSWCTILGRVVRRSLRIEMPGVTGP